MRPDIQILRFLDTLEKLDRLGRLDTLYTLDTYWKKRVEGILYLVGFQTTLL